MNALPNDPAAGRFAVPAFIAATVHVVVLFGYPEIVRLPPSTAVEPPPLLKPIPAAVLELLRPPEAPEQSDTVQPVKPLAGGPVRPESDDRSVPNRSAFEVPITERIVAPKTDLALDKIPKFSGTGGPGVATGDLRSGPPIFSLKDLDRTPRAKMQPAPEYPYAQRAAGVEGSAVVEFEVDTAGHVIAARARESTAREFEEAAVRAVLKWRFEPGRKNGRPVPFRMVVPIGFSLGAN